LSRPLLNSAKFLEKKPLAIASKLEVHASPTEITPDEQPLETKDR
jgi:hypothetical protein